MKKIIKYCALLFVVMCAGVFVACGNSQTKTSADSFNFSYVKNSATKTTDETNHTIKIELSIENKKDSENVLSASKFELKQNDEKVSSKVSITSGEDEFETEAFEENKTKTITIKIIVGKDVSGDCYLFYSGVKMFEVKL